MAIYILSPYIASGAPEALHQLCHHLNTFGIDSYIVYFDKKQDTGYPMLFQEQYPNIQEAKDIQDGSIVVFFEIMKYTLIEKLYAVRNCTYFLWWMSINHAIMYQTIGPNLEHPGIVHLFHGEFIKQYVYPLFTQNQTWYYLHDYIDTTLFREGEREKQDTIIAYNPQKDCLSAPLLLSHGYRTLPLVDLERNLLIPLLQTCKIYLDLGAHNGRDRLPREAALLGCVVLTNRFGSAAWEEDIGIPLEYKVEREAETLEMLEKVLANTDLHYQQQHEYRKSLYNDQDRFQEQIRHLLMEYVVPRGLLSAHCKKQKEYTGLLQYKVASTIEPEVQTFFHTLFSTKAIAHVTEMGGEQRRYTDLFLHELFLQTATKKQLLCVHPKKICELEIYKLLFAGGDLVCQQCMQDYLDEIPPTDLLFLNTWHNYGQLKKELQVHEKRVDKYIVLTHTILDGEHGESVRLGTDMEAESKLTGYSIEELQQGLHYAIHEFLQENSSWKKTLEISSYGGMMVLERIQRP